jgi:hypothetical protein
MAAKRKRKQGVTIVREDLAQPSQWRLQHGGFTDAVREADPETGAVVVHRYAFDTLGTMLANGTITAEMHDAGAMFRRHFRAAALDTLRAMPLIRIPGGTGESASERQVAGRARVGDAIAALGGFGSAGASCVWHVVGLECSITEWARRRGWAGKPVGHAQAQGMLVVALGVLAGHYGLTRRRAA